VTGSGRHAEEKNLASVGNRTRAFQPVAITTEDGVWTEIVWPRVDI
jgi:hypothetical protein